jgi:hypothetical protein
LSSPFIFLWVHADMSTLSLPLVPFPIVVGLCLCAPGLLSWLQTSWACLFLRGMCILLKEDF